MHTLSYQAYPCRNLKYQKTGSRFDNISENGPMVLQQVTVKLLTKYEITMFNFAVAISKDKSYVLSTY